MKKFLKRILCRHDYKTVKTVTSHDKKVKGIRKECLKCKKGKVHIEFLN